MVMRKEVDALGNKEKRNKAQKKNKENKKK